MKLISPSPLIAGSAMLALCVALFLVQSSMGAVTFGVTPSSVSNTYNGTITLSVSNVPTGDAVVIQKFIDANTNGVIDASDWLAQQFTLTDGQPGMVIGGKTNFNVPGDLNSATGAITATMNFDNGDKAGNFVGKYLFKLSSPTGHFTPITNSFTVTNYPFAQKITGNVVSNGTNVPNAAIVLMSWPMRIGVAGVIANNSGGYTIALPPGTYMSVAFKNNYIANMAAAVPISLGNGQTVTTNVALTNATASISGKVVDADNSSIGLPGLMMMGQSANGVIGIGFTDTNGIFSVGVQAGQWSVRPDVSSLVVHGYPGPQDGTNVSAGATGVTIALPKANAMIYGSVKDSLGNPIPGIDVYANDGSWAYQTDAFTGTNGNYYAAVLAGDWWVQVSTDFGPTNYLYSGGQGFALTNGQAVRWDFTAISATNHITGNLKINGTNAVGVWVQASANLNGNYAQAGADTDNSGNYWLNVANSNLWNVSVNPGGSDGLPDGFLCGNQTVGVTNNNPVVNFTALPVTNQITGHIQDSDGNSIVNLGVGASMTIGNVNYDVATGTDGGGNFSLGVIGGVWSVNVFCNGGPGGNMNNLNNLLGPGNYQCPDTRTIPIPTNNPTANFVIQLCNGVQILTTNLPDGQSQVYYDTWLEASSCYGNPNWSLNFGNYLPTGLNLDSDGHIHGTPGTGGTYNFTVHADDGNGHTADQNLSIYVAPASSPLQVTTTLLPNATNGAFYSQQLYATGGQPPYGWQVPAYSADLPANLTLAANGVLSGTLAVNGTFYFDVEVDDAVPDAAYQTLSLTIVNPPLPPLLITNASLPSGTVGAAYSAQLGATGGRSPHTWSLATGSANPPPGLTLYSSGVISGTPTTNKVSTFKVQATDADFTTTNKVLSITINPKPVLSAPAWLTNRSQMWLTGATGQNYTLQYSTTLTNWTPLFVTNNALTNSFILADPNATNNRRFYRVLIGP